MSGIDARRWLEEIAEVCEERLRQVAPAYTPGLQRVDAELAEIVLRVLRELEPEIAARAVSPLRHAVPGTAVLEALEQAVIRVDPDLGFRPYLRAVTELAEGTGTASVRKP